MSSTNEQFTEAVNHWDLETLYADLASAKGKRLTPVEKLHLRGLLCGYSPAEIAQILHKSIKGVESEVCTTLYPYVKNLVGKCNEKVENWRNICEWLDEAGYKCQLHSQQLINPIPVDILGQIANIKVEKDKITIEIDLRQTNTTSSELPKQNFNFDDNNTN